MATVKTSQLPVLTVEPTVHTGAFVTDFYCHFDHPEHYQTMLLTSQKRTTCFDLFWPVNVHVRFDSVWLLRAIDMYLGKYIINILTDFDP